MRQGLTNNQTCYGGGISMRRARLFRVGLGIVALAAAGHGHITTEVRPAGPFRSTRVAYLTTIIFPESVDRAVPVAGSATRRR